jgi:Protein of unknown function (DUF3826)
MYRNIFSSLKVDNLLFNFLYLTKTILLNHFAMRKMAAVKSIKTFVGHHFAFCSCASIARILIITISILQTSNANAQKYSNDTAYQKVIKERTAKIVAVLNINDIAQNEKVHQQLINQYLQLNALHDNSKATIASIKAIALSKEEMDFAINNETTKKQTLLKDLHKNFLTTLSTTLSNAQIEKVKDGMTYRVLPVTWKAYLEMLPQLTQEQKDKMYAWLVEARELAMDEGSSDAKHAVFGKYKGKINNYLSAAGYNMKAEGEAWAKRIQAAKEVKQIKEIQN